MSETPAIAAEGLVKNYGKTKALAGFDLINTSKPNFLAHQLFITKARVSVLTHDELLTVEREM